MGYKQTDFDRRDRHPSALKELSQSVPCKNSSRKSKYQCNTMPFQYYVRKNTPCKGTLATRVSIEDTQSLILHNGFCYSGRTRILGARLRGTHLPVAMYSTSCSSRILEDSTTSGKEPRALPPRRCTTFRIFSSFLTDLLILMCFVFVSLSWYILIF